jgi:hypothetical protein
VDALGSHVDNAIAADFLRKVPARHGVAGRFTLAERTEVLVRERAIVKRRPLELAVEMRAPGGMVGGRHEKGTVGAR